jgi:hypothetical protein
VNAVFNGICGVSDAKVWGQHHDGANSHCGIELKGAQHESRDPKGSARYAGLSWPMGVLFLFGLWFHIIAASIHALHVLTLFATCLQLVLQPDAVGSHSFTVYRFSDWRRPGSRAQQPPGGRSSNIFG